MTYDMLFEKWNSLVFRNSHIRIDAEHPLDWHIGYEGINQKTLLLVSPFEAKNVVSSKSIIVALGQRADSNWALSFKLVRSEQEGVFIRMCWDLIECSRNQSNTADGIEFVIQRYNQWLKLMEQQRTGLLSESERKGLLGELIFLQQKIENGMTAIEAVEGWIGAEGADQDFVYSDGWHEIKAPGVGSKTITISSMEQLDAQLPGELVIYLIDKTAPGESEGFTLRSKVSEVNKIIQIDVQAENLFAQKVLRYGYIDLNEYEHQWYRLSGSNRYKLDEIFPRLVRSNVHTEISSASYEINIQAIENWRVE